MAEQLLRRTLGEYRTIETKLKFKQNQIQQKPTYRKQNPLPVTPGERNWATPAAQVACTRPVIHTAA